MKNPTPNDMNTLFNKLIYGDKTVRFKNKKRIATTEVFNNTCGDL